MGVLIENPGFCEIFRRFRVSDAYFRPARQDFGWNPRSGRLPGLGHMAQKAGLLATT
jgi:hypothetical protein